MRILSFYSHDAEKAFLLEHFGSQMFFLQGEVQDYDDLSEYEKFEIISCFTGSKFDKKTISKFPNLKLIAVRSTGFDNVDINFCKELGVAVANVPTYGQNTVAEYAFSLILDIARKTHSTYEKVKKDLNFSRRGTPEIQGFDLSGKTIGIIGMGQIGKNSAQIANGFDMKILAFDLNKDEEMIKNYGVKYVELPELLGGSDIITIHLPYNEHTHHFLSKKEFNLIKKGAIFINTARGEIVDTVALYDALKSGIVSAAGLDVLEYEGYLGRESISEGKKTEEIEKVLKIVKEFIDMDNVIVTPHNAFNTREALERILQTTTQNIKRFIEGTSENIVT